MDMIIRPSEIEYQLGESIKQLRLQKNLDRKTLCERAGISLNALRHLENGEGATVKTLVRVVRALERQDWFAAIAPKVTVNPLHMVRNSTNRKRASRRTRIHGKNQKDSSL